MDINFDLLRHHLKKIKLVFDKNERSQIILSRDFLICSNYNYILTIPFTTEIGKGMYYYVENEFLDIILKDNGDDGFFNIVDSRLWITTQNGFKVDVPIEELNIDLLPHHPESKFLSLPVPIDFLKGLKVGKESTLKATELSPYNFVWCFKDRFFSTSSEVIGSSILRDEIDHFEDVFSLSVKNIDILTKLNPAEYKVTDSWIMFKCEAGDVLLVREYNFDCPSKLLENYDKFKMEYMVKFPVSILGMLEQFLVVNGKHSQHIKVSIENEKAVFTTIETKINASFPATVECNVDEQFEFYIGPKVLKESLAISRTIFINRDLNGARFTGNNIDRLIGLGS